MITKVVAKLIPGALGDGGHRRDPHRLGRAQRHPQLPGRGPHLAQGRPHGRCRILFAKAVAAGVVALLEVLYQALLSQIGKYVAKVGRRLRGVAARLTKDGPGKPGAGARGNGRHGGRGPARKPRGEEPAGRKPGSDAGTPRHADPRAP
ncbi:hypothetical protein ACFQ3Z_02000 [Streptomyces nogalater]